MPIPDLTHLQFLVLSIIGAVARPGKHVRDKLAEEGERKSLPAFYQMMSRLEDAGFVKGESRRTEVEGFPVTERWYKVTGKGLKAMETTRDFYAEHAADRLGAKGGFARA